MDDIKPGLHFDLPMDDYHAQADWHSSTQLKALLPETYKPFTGVSAAMSFGTLVHTLALEPGNAADVVPLDPAVIGVKANGEPAQEPTKTAAWRNRVADLEADGKHVVTQADWDHAIAMVDAIHDHPEAGPLIFGDNGVNEESAFWVDDAGIKHKARFDRRIPGAIIDLKTTNAQPGAYSLGKQVTSYGYELSAAHYLTVAEGLGLDVTEFLHVWVDHQYRVTVTELDDYFLARGRSLRELALQRAAGLVDPYEGATGRLLLACPTWASDDEEMEIA